MAYSTPQMPLTINIWTKGIGPPALPRITSPAQLRGIGHPQPIQASVAPSVTLVMLLCLPQGTDIRDGSVVSGEDTIECPAGSGRMYVCRFVDDIAKGFANEWRFALIAKIHPWPTPIP